MNAREKIEKLKALRGTHDQTMRCKTIEILYQDQIGRWTTVTKAFLEDAILMLEEQAYAHSSDDRKRGPVKLWPAGKGDDE